MNIDTSIHDVTSIVTGKTERRDLRGKPYYVTHLEIHTADGHHYTFACFSDQKLGMLGAVYGAAVKS